MRNPLALRPRAEALAAPLPPLLARAEHLAATVMLGEHGRRRAGQGDEFWQYRAAQHGDGARQIDWRRSARSDAQFVQEKEWQASQAVLLWVDAARSMEFVSNRRFEAKLDRARLLALAMAVLLIRGGERVALAPHDPRPRQGEMQLMRIVSALDQPVETGHAPEYGIPDLGEILPHSRAIVLSDFFGDMDGIATQLNQAADRGVKGVLLQILDPQEETFPFSGRTIFESIGGGVRHETLQAAEIRTQYQARLAARKDALSNLAQNSGWQYHCHHSDTSAQSALLWMYGAIGREG